MRKTVSGRSVMRVWSENSIMVWPSGPTLSVSSTESSSPDSRTRGATPDRSSVVTPFIDRTRAASAAHATPANPAIAAASAPATPRRMEQLVALALLIIPRDARYDANAQPGGPSAKRPDSTSAVTQFRYRTAPRTRPGATLTDISSFNLPWPERLLEIYAAESLDDFRPRALTLVRSEFGGELACHNEINLASGDSLSV